MLGPTGIGALVARPALLERMEPFLTGGSMILDLGEEGPRWNDIPYKFEAGTPMIAEAAGLHEALRYLGEIGMEQIATHERRLAAHGLQRLAAIPGLELYGPGDPTRQGAIFAFNLRDDRGALIHPHDVGTVLDNAHVAIRVGHHCAKPLMRALDVPACCRASAYLYNDRQDLDRLVAALEETRQFFSRG
jgi:cysteine desulfurase/selenocysteine lyase